MNTAVQENSGIAKQTAASYKKMSEMSGYMHEILGVFKLK